MSDYWGEPKKDHELSLMQFMRDVLAEKSIRVESEVVEICGGAGALTVTAVLDAGRKFGFYLHDGPKLRRTGKPLLVALLLPPGVTQASELRQFILSNELEFQSVLAITDADFKDRIERIIASAYEEIYIEKIEDMYLYNLSRAADTLRDRLRRE
ncbi:MAG TPA: hypothetical protein HA257_00985 [Candidatus Methanoperedenaceae archaeon]|nr:hypothetical protein [Candidatus Methanoperedenaceae archaeon]